MGGSKVHGHDVTSSTNEQLFVHIHEHTCPWFEASQIGMKLQYPGLHDKRCCMSIGL